MRLGYTYYMTHESQKIYTKTGDLGQTSLIGGKRVSKAELRLNSYGTVDELNAVLGILVSQIQASSDAKLKKMPKLNSCTELLIAIQSSLFDIGSHLACENEKMALKMPKLDSAQISSMEAWMDSVENDLASLKNFILPGGCLAASFAHMARTVARRSERVVVALNKKTYVNPEIIIFLNRLSDLLFVVARYLNHLAGVEDVIWSARKN